MSTSPPIGLTDPSAAELVPNRDCDGCTMCCKLLSIAELDKPRAVWCPHCDKKRGCKIYEQRPEACRSFYCGWRRIAHLDAQWKPSHSKILINYEEAHKRIAIHVDPDRPDAWRLEPFYSMIKRWSASTDAAGGSLVVWSGSHVTVVTPSQDKSLGSVRDDQFILPVITETPHGPMRDFLLVEADDPRLTDNAS